MAAAKGKGVPGGEASGPGGGVNVFANDGSFLELFKRRMEEASSAAARSGPEAGGREGAGAPREAEPPGEQEPEPPGKKRTGSALSFLPGSCNGCSLLSLHPGGQAERGQQASPEDRSGSQETKDRG
ncbi:telomerase RNA component interacting RNase isoform X2 [Anolis sagrei]|uniref:telomerase RNA component interacting RNase isoform X2 n=1 Tax=Anolis sagrei TaxID=38937 RepID=UPI00351FCF7A